MFVCLFFCQGTEGREIVPSFLVLLSKTDWGACVRALVRKREEGQGSEVHNSDDSEDQRTVLSLPEISSPPAEARPRGMRTRSRSLA